MGCLSQEEMWAFLKRSTKLKRGLIASYTDSLRAGWSGTESRCGGGGGVFRSHPNGPCGPARHLYKSYRVIPEGTAAEGVALTTHSF